MLQRLYLHSQAQEILDSFPPNKLDDLISLAKAIRLDNRLIPNHTRIILPKGWYYEVCPNCIIVRYQDGEQVRKEFYVPDITITFLYVEEIKVVKSLLKRLPLGYCSCGEKMRLLSALLWATDLAEQKGWINAPKRFLGFTIAFVLILWIRTHRIHEYSLIYNRHPKCL